MCKIMRKVSAIKKAKKKLNEIIMNYQKFETIK